MKRLLFTMIATMLLAGSLFAKDDEVIVTRQLTAMQRNALPEKTITVEMKRLVPAKKADAALIDAINQVKEQVPDSSEIQHVINFLNDTQRGIITKI